MTKQQSKLTSRRAVAPVIATLLLVAIAVVGGTVVFVFTQGFYNSAQVSGAPQIESLRIAGYDATDGPALDIHDGVDSGVAQGAAQNDGLSVGDRIAVYLQNNSVQKVTLSEIRFGGTVYTFVARPAFPLDIIDAFGGAGPIASSTAGYMVATNSNPSAEANVLDTTAAEIQPGAQVTFVLQLDENVKIGRDVQFKLTTTNGAVFVGTIKTGQQSG